MDWGIQESSMARRTFSKKSGRNPQAHPIGVLAENDFYYEDILSNAGLGLAYLLGWFHDSCPRADLGLLLPGTLDGQWSARERSV